MGPCGTRRVGWYRGVILLATLVLGFLSAGADMLEDHAAAPAGDHSENGARTSHLIRHHAAKSAPCSVCFFHKVLGQGLVAAQDTSLPVDIALRQHTYAPVSHSHTEYNPEVNRGPPPTL